MDFSAVKKTDMRLSRKTAKAHRVSAPSGGEGSACCEATDHNNNRNSTCKVVRVKSRGSPPELRLALDPQPPVIGEERGEAETLVRKKRGPTFYWYVRVAWEEDALPNAVWKDPDDVMRTVGAPKKGVDGPSEMGVTVTWHIPLSKLNGSMQGIANRNNTLIVKVPTRSAEPGNYTVEVSVGQAKQAVQLEASLQGRPLPHLLNGSLVVVAGAALTCVARAHPPPIAISWFWMRCDGMQACDDKAVDGATATATGAAASEPVTEKEARWEERWGGRDTLVSKLTLREPAEAVGRWLRCEANNTEGTGRSRPRKLQMAVAVVQGLSAGLIICVVGVVAFIIGAAAACIYLSLRRKRERRRLHCAKIRRLVSKRLGTVESSLPADKQAKRLPCKKGWEFPTKDLVLGKLLVTMEYCPFRNLHTYLLHYCNSSTNQLDHKKRAWGEIDMEGQMICKESNVKFPLKKDSDATLGWVQKVEDETGSKSVEIIDYNDVCAVHIIYKGNSPIDPVLKREGIEYQRSDSDEERAKNAELFNAIRKGKIGEVTLLLENGVKTNIIDRNNKENSPLHYAVEKERKEIVEELLRSKWKTNINLQNNQGNTPLHIATLKCNTELVQLLLNNQADVSIGNNNNEIPLNIAKKHVTSNGHEILSILEKNHEKHSDQIEKHLKQVKEVSDKLKEFVKSFVYIYERSLTEYYDRLENQRAKSGKWADLNNKIMKTVIGGAEGIDTAGVKATSLLGINVLQKVVSSINAKHNRDELKKLMGQLYTFKKDPVKVREELVKSGIEIFQSFESQFVQVTSGGSWKRAMEKLAHDSVNRIIYYSRQNIGEGFSTSLITKGLIFGKSKQYTHTSTTAPHIKPGHTLEVKNSSSWNTAELFDKTGLVTIKKDGIAHKYYKKKGEKSDKYGYRLLFKWESEDEAGLAKMLKVEYWEIKSTTERDEYILKPDKDLKNVLLSEINSQDPKLLQERLKENFQEVIEHVKQDAGEYFNKLESYIEMNFSELSSCIDNNQNEIKEIFSEVIRHYQEANQQYQEVAQSLKAGTTETREGFKQTNEKLSEIHNAVMAGYECKQMRRPIWFDIRESVQSFTGRQEQLEQIDTAIKQEIIVITGLGGVGKSELAIKYARSYYGKEDSAIWINAGTQETLKESFYRLVKGKFKNIKVKDIDGDERSVESIAQDVYLYITSERSLFIFDNAEKYTTIEKFLPINLPSDIKKPYVLITSSNGLEWKSSRINIRTLALGDFSNIEATEFVKTILVTEDDLQDVDIANLIAMLHNFPLALKQAVMYIRNTNEEYKERGLRYKISDYLEKYEKMPRRMLDLQFLADENIKTTFKTLKITIDKIETNNEYGQQALDMLNIMSYFTANNIPEGLFLDELADGDQEKLIFITRLLKKYLIVNLEQSMLNIHGLVQQIRRLELMNQQEEGKSLEEKTLEKALRLLKEYVKAAPENAASCIPHIISIWNYASRHKDLIKIFIIDSTYNKATTFTTYFDLIIEGSNYEVIKAIVQEINPNELKKVINAKGKDNSTPIFKAVLRNDVNIIKLLIDKGADVNAKKRNGWTPVHLAAKNGNLEVVNALLQNEAKIDDKIYSKYQFTPLHFAAQNGHKEVTKALLAKNPNVNAKNGYKFTPLHLAAGNGHIEVVEALLKNDEIIINAESKYKFTPLHLAAKGGYLSVVEALLAKDADVNIQNKDGFTPLHFATLNGDAEIVKKILENHMINIDARTTKGNTSLHFAAKQGHLKIVQTLIAENADIDIKNGEGNTATDLAHPEVKDYISSIYKRTKGAAGIEGQLCEIHLSMLLLLKGVTDERIESFRLASNMEKADKFDDIIFKYENRRGITEKSKIVFLQAKHKIDQKGVNINSLLTDSDSGDFSLKKYFISYRKIKQQFSETKSSLFSGKFEDSEFIIYTNAPFTSIDSCIKEETIDEDDILRISDCQNKYYQLEFYGNRKEKILNLLRDSSDSRRLARELVHSISSGKGIDVQKDIIQSYHITLQGKVIEKLNDKLEGKLSDNFLSNEVSLSSKEKEFRRVFLEEAGKVFKKQGNELKQELQNKVIKLSKKFGSESSSKYLELPNDDPVTEEEIKDFLNKFKLFASQPNEKGLEKVIKDKIKEVYQVEQQDIDSVFSDVEYRVKQWWQSGNNYLTKDNTFFECAARVSVKFDVKEPVTLFTGRIRELEDLHKILQEGGEAVISQMVSVTGLGGIGKSELARKYISEHSIYYDNNVIWINAENYLTIADSFRRLAQDKLQINTLDEKGKEKETKIIVGEVYSYFAKRHRKSLFVFDNAEKYKAIREREGIDMYLPSDSNKPFGPNKPSVLITSRDQEWGEIQSLPLGVFTENEAVEFIRTALKIEDGSQEREIKNLAEKLHHLPLALQQAVAYINKENQDKWSSEKFTIDNYLELYKRKANELLDKASGETYDRYTETVLTTWQVTIEKIKHKKVRGGEQALEILDIIAYLSSDKIPIDEIFSNLIGDEQVRHSAVELLDQYSMATLEGGKLSIHRLVQYVTRIKLEGQDKNEDVTEKTFKLLKKSCLDHNDKLQDNRKKNELLPHLETFLFHIDNWLEKDPLKKEVIEKCYLEYLLVQLSEIYFNLGNPRRQKELLEKALPILEKLYGPEHFKVAMILTNLSCSYGSLGDPWKEKELAEKAISITLRQQYEPEYFSVATSVLNLGNAYEDLGDHMKKKELLEWALEMQEKHYGPEHFQVAKLLASLSTTYGQIGDFHKAKELIERALSIEEKHSGPEDYEMAVILTNVGNIYGALGHHKKKIELLERALAIEEKHFGIEHFRIATALGSLGYSYRDMGEFHKAKELLERALAIEEKHYGPGHFKVATTLLNLGITYSDLRDFHKAKELLERVLIIEEKHYGSEYFMVAKALVNLGNVYMKLSDMIKAKEVLERALSILEKQYGPEHFDVAKTLLNLGIVYGGLGNHEKEKELLECALLILEKHYGPQHFEVAIALKGIGNAYGALGDPQKQKEMLERALAIDEKHYGPNHLKVAVDLRNLSNSYGALGEPLRQRELLERALAIEEKYFGPEDIEVAKTLGKLGIVYLVLDDYQKAKDLLERALAIKEKHYGPNHFEVARQLINLGSVYRYLGDYLKAKQLIERGLAAKVEHYGPEHIEVAIPFVNLGNVYGDAGDQNKKRELLERALPILERHYGLEHFEVAKTVGILGITYLALNDYQKAKDLLERALRIEEKHFGLENLEVAKTLSNLGIVYGALNNPQKRKELLERALAIDEKHYGLEHFKVATALGNLGNSYGELGDFHKAKDLLEKALAIQEKHYGSEHLEVVISLSNLGHTYGVLGNHKKKKEILERILAILEKHYGPEHFEVYIALVNLDNAYEVLCDHRNRKEILERILAIEEKHCGPEHFEVAKTLSNLGIVYGDLGYPERRKELLERALTIKEKHYGVKHFEVAIALRNLGNAYGDLGDFHKAKELLEKALAIEENHYGADHLEVAATLGNLVNAYRALDDHRRRKESLERILAIEEKHYGPEHFEVAGTLLNLGIVYGDLNDHKKNKEMLEKALPIFEKYKHPFVTDLKIKLDELGSLHFACESGNLDMVKFLIEEGTDILTRNDNDTVLHRAVMGSNDEVIMLILNEVRNRDPKKLHEHINAKDTEGDTPLMWAAESGKTNAAKILLDYGADPNVINNIGETALHWAVKGMNEEFIQLLLNKQADPNISDKNGKTPLSLAYEKLDCDQENNNLKAITALLLSVTNESHHIENKVLTLEE